MATADREVVPSRWDHRRLHAFGFVGAIVASAAAARALDPPPGAGPGASTAPTAAASPSASNAAPEAPQTAPSATAVESATAPSAVPSAMAPEPVPAPATPGASSATPASTASASGSVSPISNTPSTASPTPTRASTNENTTTETPHEDDRTMVHANSTRDARRISVEAVGGPNAHNRFPTVERASYSKDAVDATLAATGWVGLDEQTALGVGYGYVGLGSESFAIDEAGNSLDASYNLHLLWLRGRWYVRPIWPSFYFGVGVGFSLQSVRATGTRSDSMFTAPGRPFQCSAIGGFGGAASATAGAEVKLPSNFAFVAELEGSGHLMRGASNEFGSDCPAPGAGPAIQGALRAGFAYYWPL